AVAVFTVVPALERAGDARAALTNGLRQRQSAGGLSDALGTPLRLPQWGPRLLCATDERSARGGACQDADQYQCASVHSCSPWDDRHEKKAPSECGRRFVKSALSDPAYCCCPPAVVLTAGFGRFASSSLNSSS